MNRSLRGIFAPIVTVFNNDESIDYGRIRENIEYYNTTSLNGYMPLGSNGEFQGLEDSESFHVLKTVYRASTREKVIVGGCGRESVAKTIQFIRSVADIGLDYAFILAPHYFSFSQSEEGLYAYFTRIADLSPIPIVIYNAPKFCNGILLSAELISRLSSHQNIAGIKNSSTENSKVYFMNRIRNDFCLLGGNINNLLNSLENGASGGVISTACFLPEQCCQLYQAYQRGLLDKAREISKWLQMISSQSAGPLSVPGVKACMELRGLHGGHVRLPLMDIPETEYNRIANFFNEQEIHRCK